MASNASVQDVLSDHSSRFGLLETTIARANASRLGEIEQSVNDMNAASAVPDSERATPAEPAPLVVASHRGPGGEATRSPSAIPWDDYVSNQARAKRAREDAEQKTTQEQHVMATATELLPKLQAYPSPVCRLWFPSRISNG